MANQEVAEKKPSQIAGFFAPVQKYFRETFGELRKVHWPTWPEARTLTGVVLAVMLAMAIFLGLFDFLFGELMIRVLRLEIIYIAVAVVISLSIIVLVLFAGRDRR
jgi:preprotein translocase subunit SecE